MEEFIMNEKWAAFTRLILFALPLLNAALAMAGMSPLPIEEVELEALISTIVALVFGFIAWFKDNNVTKKAVLKKEATEGKTEEELKQLADL